MNNYVYDDDYAPLLPKGTILKITAWHDNTAANKSNPDPNAVGRLGRPHRRRDGPRVGQHHLHERRGLQEGSRRAQGQDGDHDRAPAAVVSRRVLNLKGRRSRRPFVFRRSFSCLLDSSGASARLLVVAACSPAPDALAQQLAMEPLKDSGSEHLSRVRRLVPERRRHLQAADRLLQPQQEADPRHPDRAQQPHRAGRSRPGPAHALPRRAAAGASSRSRCRRISATRSSIWTLTANGKTVTIPFGLTKGYQIEPYKDAAMGNTPPTIKFAEDGAAMTGPPGAAVDVSDAHRRRRRGRFRITFWITDDGHDETPTGGGAAAPLRRRRRPRGPPPARPRARST